MTDAAEGLERVYREEAPRLWRALVAYSGDPDVASDAVAEAFAQAFLPTRTPETAGSWRVRTRALLRRAMNEVAHVAFADETGYNTGQFPRRGYRPASDLNYYRQSVRKAEVQSIKSRSSETTRIATPLMIATQAAWTTHLEPCRSIHSCGSCRRRRAHRSSRCLKS